MKLADFANCLAIDADKLTEYALNPDSPWGGHKAKVFRELLGFTRENYADLLAQIEEKALAAEAIFHSEDEFGQRYTVDILIRGTEERQAVVRTGWLIPPGSSEARLITST